MKLFKNKLFLIIVFGLILRILLFLWTNQYIQNGDLYRYIDWGKISYLHGFEKTYHKEFINFGESPNNQPPGSLYISSISFNTYLKASNLTHKLLHQKPGSLTQINSTLINLIFRIPSFIAEVVITILIYFVLKKHKNTSKNLAASIYFLNPITIHNGTIWGQMDAVNNLFFFLAIYLLMERKIFLSIFSYSLSLFTKLSLLPLLPLYITSYFKLETKKYLLLAYIPIIAVIILFLTLPISNNPLMWIIKFFIDFSGGELQYITSGAFNLWYAIFKITNSNIPLETNTLLGIPMLVIGYLLYFIFLIPLAFKKITKHPTFKIFLYMSLVSLIAFLFLPKMHERYLYPFFPLFAVVVGFERKYLKYMLIISFIHFANLFLAWNPTVIPFLPYALIYNNTFQAIISLMLIIVFGGLYRNALRKSD